MHAVPLQHDGPPDSQTTKSRSNYVRLEESSASWHRGWEGSHATRVVLRFARTVVVRRMVADDQERTVSVRAHLLATPIVWLSQNPGKSVLAGNFSDVRITIVLNVNGGPHGWLLNDLRFGVSAAHCWRPETRFRRGAV